MQRYIVQTIYRVDIGHIVSYRYRDILAISYRYRIEFKKNNIVASLVWLAAAACRSLAVVVVISPRAVPSVSPTIRLSVCLSVCGVVRVAVRHARSTGGDLLAQITRHGPATSGQGTINFTASSVSRSVTSICRQRRCPTSSLLDSSNILPSMRGCILAYSSP